MNIAKMVRMGAGSHSCNEYRLFVTNNIIDVFVTALNVYSYNLIMLT